MSLEYYDKVEIIRATEAAQKKTVKELRENLRDSVMVQREMQENFNRMAKAIEALTAEVKALREEQNPKLDKTKLAAPAAKPAGA